MITGYDRSEPGLTTINKSHPLPTGIWTIDPADSIVSFAWRTLRLWTVTGRLHGLGVVHLDDLPPVGVIRFEQPSGLPVLTMALDPASVDTGDADLAAMLRGPAVSAACATGGGPSAAKAWKSSPAEPGGSWRRSPPQAPKAWSSCTWRSTPGRAALTGWCCADEGCWIDGSSALASGPRSSAPRSSSI
jgi:hypothetical protein